MKISLNITLNFDRAKPEPKKEDDGPDVRTQVGAAHTQTGFYDVRQYVNRPGEVQ